MSDMDPLGYVPALISHACCTCKKFYNSKGFSDYKTAHDDDGICLEPKNQRNWTRGYFGCQHHEPDATMILKMTAQNSELNAE